MLILWIPLVLIVMYIILHAVFVFLWPKGIHVELDFKQRKVTEGQEAVLLETLKNNKFLPLPVIRMQFKLDRGLQILENENVNFNKPVGQALQGLFLDSVPRIFAEFRAVGYSGANP